MNAKKRKAIKVSPADVEILQILWEHDRVGLSQAQQLLGRPIGYTTMQTRLNRLVGKGLVKRSNARPALYSANVEPQDVSARYLDLLMERVSGGNVVPLVAHLMKHKSLGKEEIKELKKLIAEAERKS